MKKSEINLGGFPPIIYINNDTKKKREFDKKVSENLDSDSYKNLNILNIKNILNDTSKKTEEK